VKQQKDLFLRNLKRLGIAAIALSIGLTACGNKNITAAADCSWAQNPGNTSDLVAASHYDKAPATCITKDTSGTYTATIHTKKGDIAVTLDQHAAPASVNNFVFLATHHFYDNVLFHRVVSNFVIQAGDPNSAIPGADPASFGSGGPGYTIPDEFPKSASVFTQGCMAMANKGPGTSGSQFFICSADDSKKLAPYYNDFGNVTSGMNVVSQIVQGDAITSIDISKS